MSWQLGTGELASRIAAAMGVRGRIPAELDSLVVPVALIDDRANEPPFRSDGRLWCGTDEAGAVAGNDSAIRIRNVSFRPQVIDRMWISVTLSGGVQFRLEATPVLDVGGAFFTFERIPVDDADQVQRIAITHTGINYLTGATPPGTVVWRQTVVTGVIPPQVIEGPWILPPRSSWLLLSEVPVCGILASFLGRYFEQP